jgi:hypothetical protein
MRSWFGLGALFVLAGLPIYGQEEDAKERQALAAIEELPAPPEWGPGKTIVRDKNVPGNPVIKLGLCGIKDIDSVLPLLKHFRSLRALDLTYSPITDDSLKHLAGLHNLKTLSLCMTPVTDKGLAHLKSLKELQELSLAATDVSGEGLQQLTSLPKLKKLSLTRDFISDEAVEKLQKSIPSLNVERGNGNTAEKRVRKFFSIAENKSLTDETIKAAVRDKIPIGSSEKQLLSTLKKCGVVKDKLGYIFESKNGIGYRTNFDPESGYVVHTHYCIIFEMDAAKKLTDIEVKVWYTGP